MSEGSQSVDEVLFLEIFASYDASNWDIPKQRPMAPELRRCLRFSSRIVLRCSLFNCGGIITRDLMDTELKTIFPKTAGKEKKRDRRRHHLGKRSRPKLIPRKTHPVGRKFCGVEEESEQGGDSEEEKRMRLPLRTPSRRTAIPNQNRVSLKGS